MVPLDDVMVDGASSSMWVTSQLLH